LEVVNEQEEDTSKPMAKKKQKAKLKQPKGKGKKFPGYVSFPLNY